MAEPYYCDIVAPSKPFRELWNVELRRPGRATVRAQCLVVPGTRPSGETELHIHWKGTDYPADVRALLQQAMSARLAEALPPNHDLVEVPSG